MCLDHDPLMNYKYFINKLSSHEFPIFLFHGVIDSANNLMTGKMYYASNNSHFIGDLHADSIQPKDGTMIYSDGMIYDGEFAGGVPDGSGQMFSTNGIYTGSQFSGGGVSSGNLTANTSFKDTLDNDPS